MGGDNKLHWILDVKFNENQSRKRQEKSDQNYYIILKVALNLLKNYKTVKQGVKDKRLKDGVINTF